MKEKKHLILYYIVLLTVLLSWQSTTDSPPMPFRIAFLSASVIPLLGNYSLFLPACLLCFFTISNYGYAMSYMPGQGYYYVYIIILLIALFISKRIGKGITILLLMSILTFFVDITSSGSIQNINYAFLFLYLLTLFVDNEYGSMRESLQIAWIIIAFVLSVLFLVNRNVFVETYSGDIERSGWTDPNYFGMLVAMGAFAALVALYTKKNTNRFIRFFFITTLLLSILFLISNASRGSILCLGISFIFFVLSSKVNWEYKILVVTGVSLFIYYLYTSNVFNLLIYRLQNDDGTGSGRTDIWMTKIHAWQGGNLPSYLFGYGYERGLLLGYGSLQGFHNDFVALLCDYGIVGLIGFLLFVFYPLKYIKKYKQNRAIIINGIVFLLVCFFTLEPITTGRLPYFFFYFYFLLLAHQNKICIKTQ